MGRRAGAGEGEAGARMCPHPSWERHPLRCLPLEGCKNIDTGPHRARGVPGHPSVGLFPRSGNAISRSLSRMRSHSSLDTHVPNLPCTSSSLEMLTSHYPSCHISLTGGNPPGSPWQANTAVQACTRMHHPPDQSSTQS